MNALGRIKQLIQASLVAAIVLATIMGSALLSSQDTIARPVSSPSSTAPERTSPPPTEPTETPLPSFTPTGTPPQPGTQPPTETATATTTPSPTPTVCVPPPGWQPYIVGSFDTLALIAQRFNTSIELLVQANCLSTNNVTLGQRIYVPSTTPMATTAPCFPPPFNWVIYVVQPGDTLTSIALRYNVSLLQLLQANCLNINSRIYAGQTLRVPPLSPTFTPRPTSSSTPTVTPLPTATPTPTAPAPTNTPAVTLPQVTDTPAPTATPTDTPSATPTGTTPSPTPTDTLLPPTPTETPIPPRPTDTVTWTPTPSPSPTPSPTLVTP